MILLSSNRTIGIAYQYYCLQATGGQIVRSNSLLDAVDFVTQDDMRVLANQTSAYITTNNNLYVDSWTPTTWVGFRVNDVSQSPFVAFSVSGSSLIPNATNDLLMYLVTFSQVLVDSSAYL